MKLATIIAVMLVSTLGPSMVIAAVGYSSIQALSRNPSAAPKIQSSMILAFVFAEAMAVISMLVIFFLFVK